MLIANRILQRINDSIDISYKQKDIELEKYRIAESEYAGLLEPANSLLIKSGFTEFKTDCTKWIFNTDSLRMSRRVQWNNNQTFFSFDVTKFSTSDEALDAAQTLSLVSRVPFSEEIPTSMRRIPYCNLQDTNSIETAIAHCEYRKRDISVVGSISNYAILFYYYNAPAVDKLFFENVVMAINQQANTVNKSEPKPKIRIFPNPASDLINIVLSGSKNTNTIIQLIDLEGRIMRIENIGSLNEYCMNIAELNSGMYILQIKNSMDTYRKLIKIH